MDLRRAAWLFAASTLAGAINAVAGGGTLVSFPAALAAGLDPVVANATNAAALTPASLAAAFGYRRELAQDRRLLARFLPAAFVGGLLGAALLLRTPQRVFDAAVPALVLFAALLLLAQNLRRPEEETAAWSPDAWVWWAPLLQLLVGVYGGYFGAAMGIMMLAILGRVGGRDIHRMNGVKSVLGAAINATATATFVLAGKVDLRAAAVMTAGAIAGGALGATLARRVPGAAVRWFVVALGLVLSAQLALRALR